MRLIFLVVVVCCVSNTRQKDLNNLVEQKDNSAKNEIGISLINKSANYFSSTIKKDTFILVMKGDFLTKSNISFSIITFENSVIFEEQFPTIALYGFGPDVTKPEPDSITVERYLIERFNNFFSHENFILPAIKPNAKYDKDYNDVISKDEWNQIKINSSSIGFGFTLWEESISYITYLNSKRKAVVYHVCC